MRVMDCEISAMICHLTMCHREEALHNRSKNRRVVSEDLDSTATLPGLLPKKAASLLFWEDSILGEKASAELI